MAITIKEVTTNKEFNAFFQFPYQLFKKDKRWVPQMLAGEKTTFNPRINPSFDFCKAKMFLAYKEKKIVGRVAGIINPKVNEVWGQQRVRFGWLDFINDKEVARQLLQAVEDWGKSEGLSEIVGPMGFSNLDRTGMVIEGFEVEPPSGCYWNPEYYPEILNALGYTKEVDTIQYEMQATHPIPEKVLRINNMIKEKYNLSIVEGISKKELATRYGVKLFHAINKSYEGLFGVIPLTERQIDYYIKQYFPYLNLKTLCFIVDEHDDIVAFGLSLPSLTKAYRKSKGKLFPFGWIHLLKGLRNYEKIELLLTGVTPEWQNKGVHSLYHAYMNQNYLDLRVKTALANPQLESNEAHRIWQKYDSKIVIRRRIYIMKIR
jgi:GNAT superfamily N-acetyltransferase